MAGRHEDRAERRVLLVNVFAWTANVSTSVLIIFVLKALMSVYLFKYATTISGLHFVVCAWAVWGFERAGLAEPADMPLRATLTFAVVGALSIGFANLSLLLNSVGFYQVAKLLMSPFVATVEMMWLGRRFSGPVLVCMAVVLAGVGLVTVSDVTIHPTGVVMAGAFIVTGGLQQILCGHMQSTFKLQSHQLMSNTSFLQGMILMIVGPFVDKLACKKWIMEWEASVPGIEMLALSCALAVAVNASQYLVLGRFSATSFQVLGHAKTLLVLIGGWLLFDEPMNARKAAGMFLAFSGMVGYGFFASRPAAAAAAALSPFEHQEEQQRLLLGAGAGRGSGGLEAGLSGLGANGVRDGMESDNWGMDQSEGQKEVGDVEGGAWRGVAAAGGCGVGAQGVGRERRVLGLGPEKEERVAW